MQDTLVLKRQTDFQAVKFLGFHRCFVPQHVNEWRWMECGQVDRVNEHQEDITLVCGYLINCFLDSHFRGTKLHSQFLHSEENFFVFWQYVSRAKLPQRSSIISVFSRVFKDLSAPAAPTDYLDAVCLVSHHHLCFRSSTAVLITVTGKSP